MAELPDYYALLGIPRTAERRQIRAAYRRLAMRHHPDVNPADEDDDAATEFMICINDAYETLHDPEKRSSYDRAWAASACPPPQPQYTVPPDGVTDNNTTKTTRETFTNATPHHQGASPNVWFGPSWLERYWMVERHLRDQLAPLFSILGIMLPVFGVAVLFVVAFFVYLLLSGDRQSAELASYVITAVGGSETIAAGVLLVLLLVTIWIVWRANFPHR